MKKTFLLLLVIALLSLSACTTLPAAFSGAAAIPGLAAQGTEPVRTITTTGSAQILVVPDQVILTLGIETFDKDLNLAKTENDSVMTKLLDVTKRYGVEQQYIQTGFLGIEPTYKDTLDRSTLLGYFVRKNVVLTLKDLSKFDSLLTDALAAGVNYVQGIEFRTSELNKYREQARSEAIKAARQKASDMLFEFGDQVAQPLSIKEDLDTWVSGYTLWWGAAYSGMTANTVKEAGNIQGTEGTTPPGQISVTARVTVEFKIK